MIFSCPMSCSKTTYSLWSSQRLNSRQRTGHIVTAVIIVILLSLSTLGCNRRSARKYKRLRETYPETYRVALMRVSCTDASLNREEGLILDDHLYRKALGVEKFRVTDSDTVTAWLGKNGHHDIFTHLPPEVIHEAAENLDIEAFIIPVTKGNRTNALNELSLINGYNGHPLWRGTDSITLSSTDGPKRVDTYSESFEELLSKLTTEASSMRIEKEPLPADSRPSDSDEDIPYATHVPEFDIPAQSKRSTPSSLFSDFKALKVFTSSDGTRLAGVFKMNPPVDPSYEAGIEQLLLTPHAFSLITPISTHTPLRSVKAVYVLRDDHHDRSGDTIDIDENSEYVTLTIFDLHTPQKARLFVDDLFTGATPKLLKGTNIYAIRDSNAGEVATGFTIGKFAIVADSPSKSEEACGILTEDILNDNTIVRDYFRKTPSPEVFPAKKNCVTKADFEDLKSAFLESANERMLTNEHNEHIAKNTHTVTETRYKIQKVEVPVVPQINVYIDGKTLLNLVKDESLSNNSVLILRTDGSQAGNGHPNQSTGVAEKRFSNDTDIVPIKTISDIKRSLKAQSAMSETSEQTHPSENDNAEEGMTTQSSAARLRFDLGCRYMSTSRYDMAMKEFIHSFELDNSYLAPIYKLKEISEITGKEVEIPTAKDKDTLSTEKNGTESAIQVTIHSNSVENTTNTTIHDGTIETERPSVDETSETTNPSNNNEKHNSSSQNNSSEENGAGDSILFTGLTIAVILVIIKLVFLDDGKHQ